MNFYFIIENNNKANMKFQDPLTTLQYMGGAIPIHIAMLVYCLDEYSTNTSFFSSCRSTNFVQLNYDDVIYMMISHALCIIFKLTQLSIKGDKFQYLKLSLKHLNLTIYMLAILFV